jgi:hypothetical protein
MELYCERKDVAVFEALGFTQQDNFNVLPPNCVYMVDEEANYAHCDEMPGKLFYYGRHESGCEFDGSDFACAGDTYQEWRTGKSGCYVFPVDETHRVTAETYAQLDAFLATEAAAMAHLRP